MKLQHSLITPTIMKFLITYNQYTTCIHTCIQSINVKVIKDDHRHLGCVGQLLIVH